MTLRLCSVLKTWNNNIFIIELAILTIEAPTPELFSNIEYWSIVLHNYPPMNGSITQIYSALDNCNS